MHVFFFLFFSPFFLINLTSAKYIATISLSYAFNNLRVATFHEKRKNDLFSDNAVPFPSTRDQKYQKCLTRMFQVEACFCSSFQWFKYSCGSKVMEQENFQ